jgi:hypothetical protein
VADGLGWYRYDTLASTLLMANDIPNATAAFAVAMKALEASAKKRALAEEIATEQEKREREKETAQDTDASAPVDQPAEIPEEDDGELVDGPSDVESGKFTSLLLYLPPTNLISLVSSSSSSSSYAHPLLSSFTASSYCDGPCDTSDLDYKELHACTICCYVALCDACLPVFQTGGFPGRICNVRHTFFKVFPLPEGSADVAVRIVEGRVVGREEWLAGLREKYADGKREEGAKEEGGVREEGANGE